VPAETLAVEEIAAAGPGGNFMVSDLTARRFRQDLWQPGVWDWEALPEWLASGSHSDRSRAKQRIREILSSPPSDRGISAEFERDLRAIIERAIAAGDANQQR
jgi:trimethylamine:corrinoid methyltransferase-like protein